MISQPLIAEPLARCRPFVRPLIDVLSDIPDVRKSRGKRHSLPAVLALVCVATLCGYKSYSAIAQWARVYPKDLVVSLGLSHKSPPCAATLSNVLRGLDRGVLETKLSQWAQSVLEALPPDPSEEEAVALDGKALRGSKGQGAPSVHLLSALSHRLGLTLNQEAVSDKTNEISHAIPLLQGLTLKGRVFTMDTMLTQRTVAKTIVESGADYLMLAKANQPRLAEDISLVFARFRGFPQPIRSKSQSTAT